MTKTIKRPLAFLSAMVMVMAMLLYFPSETFRNIDWGLTAFAEGYDANGFGSDEDPYLACAGKMIAQSKTAIMQGQFL